MDNRDIFDFDFVDRTKEQIILNRFLNNQYNDNFLWIDGDSGIGKTFLIKNAILTNKEINSIYVNLPVESDNEKCIARILKEIQKYNKYENISDFIKNNYSSVLDISKGVVSDFIKDKYPTIDTIFSTLLDGSKMFIDNEKKNINSIKLLEQYVNYLIKKEKIVLIIDNFTYCDETSLQILQQLLYKYIQNDRMKCIFITTQDVLKDKESIQIFLMEKIPIKHLHMSPLGEAKYFFSILESIFEIDNKITEQVNILFDLCGGNPEDLKAFLRKLFLSDAINISEDHNSRAKINAQIMRKQLINKSIELETNDFSEDEQFILLILLGFRGEVEIKLLQDAIIFIHNKLFKLSIWTAASINIILSRLEYMNLIEITKNDLYKIKISHDKVYFSLLTILNSNINGPLISNYFFKFLQEISSTGKEYDIDLNYLLAFHSYNSKNNNWEEINYRYAETLYNDHNYYEASKVFARIISEIPLFSHSQKLLIAKCFYEVGEYNTAKSILDCIDITSERIDFLFDYHYLMGKIENILLNKHDAILNFDKAYTYAQDRNSQILMLHLKHLSLLETPAGKEEARQIFNSIALNLTPSEEHLLSVCFLLRNCNQFYTGATALAFFNKAIKIAEENHSPIDKAYVLNNLGLEYFRTGDYDIANKKFENSYNILYNNKIHECSYPLNNIAVYKMFQGNYSEALTYLLDAQYLNQSIYASLAIKVHMMVCYRKLGKEKNCRRLMTQLSDYLKNQKIGDFNIIRKLAINLCISHKEYKELSDAAYYIEIALPYVRGTISEYRGISLQNQLLNRNDSIVNALKSNAYYTRLDFEPWIITLSHD